MSGSADVCGTISIEYRNFAFALVFGMLVFFIITSTIIAQKHITVIHCAMPTLLLSILISYLISLTSNKSIITNAITNDFIYKYLLPIIVLTEGFNMKNRSVQTYGRENTTLGIIIPIFIIVMNSALLYGIQKLAFSMTSVDEAYYMATPVLMSIAITMNNVDLHGSIAPLMTIKNMRMYKILFSSGLLSNNMCLIFVMTFERMLIAGSFGTDTFIPDFFKVGAFSICLGLIIGGIVSLIMKNSPSLGKNPIYETLFVIIGAYLSYCLSHLSFFQLSGDVAIFFYGIMMAHYNKYNMSAESFRNIGLTFNLLLQFAEAICFIYIGLSFQDAVIGRPMNFGFAGILILTLLVTRVIVISFAAAFCGWWSPGLKVKGKEWGAVILAGMVRGPMAYIFSNVLVPVRSCIDVKNYFQYAKAFPIFIMQITVVFSIVVMIPLNFVFFHIFIKKEIGEGEEVLDDTLEHEAVKKEILQGRWKVDSKRPRVFRYVDEYYFKPMLIRDYHNRRVVIDDLKQKYDRIAGLYDHGVHLEHELHHENLPQIERHKSAKRAAKEIAECEARLKKLAFWRGIWEDYSTKGKSWKENQKKLDPNFVSTFERWDLSPETLYNNSGPKEANKPKAVPQATPQPPGYKVPPTSSSRPGSVKPNPTSQKPSASPVTTPTESGKPPATPSQASSNHAPPNQTLNKPAQQPNEPKITTLPKPQTQPVETQSPTKATPNPATSPQKAPSTTPKEPEQKPPQPIVEVPPKPPVQPVATPTPTVETPSTPSKPPAEPEISQPNVDVPNIVAPKPPTKIVEPEIPPVTQTPVPEQPPTQVDVQASLEPVMPPPPEPAPLPPNPPTQPVTTPPPAPENPTSPPQQPAAANLSLDPPAPPTPPPAGPPGQTSSQPQEPSFPPAFPEQPSQPDNEFPQFNDYSRDPSNSVIKAPTLSNLGPQSALYPHISDPTPPPEAPPEELGETSASVRVKRKRNPGGS